MGQGMINSDKQGWGLVGDMAKGLLVGGAAGAAGAWAGGAAAGALNLGGFLGGATSGAAGGFTGGFVGGAGNAWLNGADFLTGLEGGINAGIIGGIAGGVLGGISRGILDARKGYNFWNGSTVDEIITQGGSSQDILQHYNSSSQANINDEMLKSRIKSEFRVQEGDFNIKKITTKTSSGYNMDSSGKYINMKSKATVGGYLKRFSSGYSRLHVSPHYTMSSSVAFRAVAGHELIHAYHHFSIPNFNRVFSERVAYKYTHNTYMGSGQPGKAFRVLKTAMSHGYWGTYPKQYQIPTPLGW